MRRKSSPSSVRKVSPSEPEVELDKRALKQFWQYIRLRHGIYIKRHIMRLPPPWTDDPILDQYRFCNVYRELDRGTIYLLDTIISQAPTAPLDIVFFNICLYRRWNLPDTMELLAGFQNEWEPDIIQEILLDEQLSGNPIGSPAWMINAIGAKGNEVGSGTKLQIARLSKTWETRHKLVDRIWSAKDRKDAHRALMTVPGAGPFIAYQLLLDLSYLPSFPHREATDWCYPGPGAVPGLEILAGKKLTSQKTQIAIIQRLKLMQHGSLWGPLGADFFGHRLLDIDDIQFNLCEFRKLSVARATGYHKRRFRH